MCRIEVGQERRRAVTKRRIKQGSAWKERTRGVHVQDRSRAGKEKGSNKKENKAGKCKEGKDPGYIC